MRPVFVRRDAEKIPLSEVFFCVLGGGGSNISRALNYFDGFCCYCFRFFVCFCFLIMGISIELRMVDCHLWPKLYEKNYV